MVNSINERCCGTEDIAITDNAAAAAAAAASSRARTTAM